MDTLKYLSFIPLLYFCIALSICNLLLLMLYFWLEHYMDQNSRTDSGQEAMTDTMLKLKQQESSSQMENSLCNPKEYLVQFQINFVQLGYSSSPMPKPQFKSKLFKFAPKPPHKVFFLFKFMDSLEYGEGLLAFASVQLVILPA